VVSFWFSRSRAMSAMSAFTAIQPPPPMPQLGIQRGYVTSSQTIAAILDPCHHCSPVVRFLFSRSPDHQMSRSPDLFAALCLCPSARDPPP
jgi:hypothetical protein